ncbi:putative transmembrane protein [Rhodopirellula islandica]|uniref:Transmembrane protein n=1 Tax=Rhodopirellula islandica TaxID=595434 RepID=A0A0J1BB12_RHOIS|nr:ABC transporter permease [Rhodopirellula islandica]KLU03723.1 putative transmembrane protein [Rhodopirellula islandica]
MNWRPYFAVVWDSFHAAMASRVLWAAMLAIWILLAMLAPIGVREDYTTTFRFFDVYNGTRMKAMLAQGMVDPDQKDAPLGRIAAAMPEELSRKLQRVGEGDEVRIPLPMLTDALNELIDQDFKLATNAPDADEESGETSEKASDSRHWYDAQAWQETVRLRELRELDEKPAEELADSLIRRRARLRIEAALPGVFEARSARSVLLTYGTLDFPTGFEIDRTQFESLFNQFVIPTLVHWLLGFVLVFLGVLVTASMIPDMLQTGSLHLLLSKPVSRPALLLAKFVGGCAFVFLCVAQLVIGLYLIAGMRLEIWNPRILWCIPVAVFLFAVFFSVSVPAGLKWRSPIISIAAAGALAAICLVFSIIAGVFDTRIVQPERISGLVRAGDDLISVTNGGGLNRMDEDQQQWVPVIESKAMSNDRVLRPVAIDDDHVLTARIRNGKFNPFGSGSLDLIVLARDNDWKPQPGLRLPTATERLIPIGLTDKSGSGQTLAVNTADLLITQNRDILSSIGKQVKEESDDPDSDSDGGADGRSPRGQSADSIGAWLSTLVTMQGGATEEFVSILPRNVALSPPIRLAVPLDAADLNGESASESTRLLILNGSQLQQLVPDGDPTENVWQRDLTADLPRSDTPLPPVLAASNRYVVASTGDEVARVFTTKDLSEIFAGDWPDDIAPLSLHAVAEDLFLVVTTEGSGHLLRVVEKQGDEPGSENHPLQVVATLPVDEIETAMVEFTPDSSVVQLVVAHDVDRVSEFHVSSQADTADLSVVRSIEPKRSFWRRVDRYGIGLLELLTPQVLALGDTTAGMVSGKKAFIVGGGDMEAGEVVRYGIATPIISCGVFIAVMLTLSCVYFARSDF